ncbi:heparinase II/III domain-containing protein [Spirosoma aerophilum]
MKYAVFVLLFSVGTFCTGQITPRNMFGKTYSLEIVRTALVTRNQWVPYPKTPSAWQVVLPDSVRRQLVHAGELVLDKPFAAIPATTVLEYTRTGNRSNYERLSFSKRNQLMALVLAESVEGKGRFLDAIVNGVWSICEEPYWGSTAHLSYQQAGIGLPDVNDRTVDLFGSETAAVLALTDYFAGDQLAKISPLIRPRIYDETNKRLSVPLLTNPDRYGYLKKGAKVNNWNPWIMSNWLLTSLLLEPDNARRSLITHTAMGHLDTYLNGLGDDGGCDEGPLYWFLAGGCVFDALELLHSATAGKIDLYSRPLIRNMASYIYKMHIDSSYFVGFADALPTLQPDGPMLYRFGKRIQDDTLTNFGRWSYSNFGVSSLPSPAGKFRQEFNRHRQLNNLLTIRDLGPPDKKPFLNVPIVWFPDVQVMTARSPKGLFLATHGGHNAESHNHNDVGDFVVYADGQPVIIDVGRGAYTGKTFSAERYSLWFNTSPFHNVPLVNGIGQQEGRAFEARSVSQKTAKQTATLTMDLVNAYPAQAGIQRWNRSVTLNRKKETITIADDYALSPAPKSVQQVFMTTCTVDANTPGKLIFQTSKGRVALNYDAALWQASVETVPLTTPEDAPMTDYWGGHPVRRIVLAQPKPAATGHPVFTISKLY